MDKAEEQIAGYERAQSLPPLENALDPYGDKFVATAFIVRKNASGRIVVSEALVGRIPSDPEKYLSSKQPSGEYLVGSLAPRGGYTIYEHHEERFCIRITRDGRYLFGPGISRPQLLDGIRRRLINQSEAAAGDGDKPPN